MKYLHFAIFRIFVENESWRHRDHSFKKQTNPSLSLYLKVGEIWGEVCAELKEEAFRPVTPDQEALQVITEAFENIGKMVVSLQTEMLESQQYQELQEEEKTYAKVTTGTNVWGRSVYLAINSFARNMMICF